MHVVYVSNNVLLSASELQQVSYCTKHASQHVATCFAVSLICAHARSELQCTGITVKLKAPKVRILYIPDDHANWYQQCICLEIHTEICTTYKL